MRWAASNRGKVKYDLKFSNLQKFGLIFGFFFGPFSGLNHHYPSKTDVFLKPKQAVNQDLVICSNS